MLGFEIAGTGPQQHKYTATNISQRTFRTSRLLLDICWAVHTLEERLASSPQFSRQFRDILTESQNINIVPPCSNLAIDTMAILKDGDDTYEVRIKRYPDGSYFDEHIKIEDREKPGARSCTRYIVGEENVRYAIEIILRKGFSFGTYNRVRAHFYFKRSEKSICRVAIHKPKELVGLTTADIIKKLEYANVTVAGCKMQGTRLSFRGLVVGDDLKKSTNIMGIEPESLGYFNVRIYKSKLFQKALIVSKPEVEEKKLWDAKKVDEDSFSKHGITCAVGFTGGRQTQEWMPRKYYQTKRGTEMNFNFCYRSADFIQQTGIIAYPPPLYLYAWKELDSAERKSMLKELQEINKNHVHAAMEAKSGGIIEKHGKGRKADEPKEWRAWDKMYEWEREATFNTLKKAKRAHERGEVQSQFENNRGEIISLIDDEPKTNSRPEPKQRAQTVIEADKFHEDKLQDSKINRKAMNKSEIKAEPIDVDLPPAKKPKLNPSHVQAGDDSDDEELKKKREKARRLAEDIEIEERLVKMKREKRALEAEIEAAEMKKSSRKK